MKNRLGRKSWMSDTRTNLLKVLEIQIMRIIFLSTYRSCIQTIAAAAFALISGATVTADDLDVYDAVLASQNKPNILFLLDYSGSMNFDIYGDRIDEDDTTTASRFDILSEAVSDLLTANQGKINVGLGSLYATSASGAKWPISDLTEDASIYDSRIPVGTKTVNDAIISLLERNTPNGLTNTTGALAEAAAYYRGDPVLHGDEPLHNSLAHEPDVWGADGYEASGGRYSANPATYSPFDAYEYGVDHPAGSYALCENGKCDDLATYDCGIVIDPEGEEDYVCKYPRLGRFSTTPTYTTPLASSCQSNYMVLISDGQPSVLWEDNTLKTVLSAAGLPGGQLGQCVEQEVYEGTCAAEIVNYLANNDINPDVDNSSVKTYTVGFGVSGKGETFLDLLATEGNGEFFSASEPAELTDALNSIIDTVVGEGESFAEISVELDPASISHSNRTYLSLFRPSTSPSWQGNLKGYFIGAEGLIDIHGNSATVDNANGLTFAETAQSFWSSIPDGADILMGGASEGITELPPGPNTRNIYTYLGGAGTNLALSDDAQLVSTNTAISDALLGNPGAALRAESLDWIANAPMGDPLHTKPMVIKYDTRDVAYIMTNQGFIHAFDVTNPIVPDTSPADVSGGEELFAFMPKELLKNIPKHYSPIASAGHVYGLDGTITRWHEDANGDGYVNGTDTVMVVFGMRRGGTSYYALDVTDPTSPKFEWQINNDQPGFTRLAQSWSKASLVTVNNNGANERVLMFGGGYDADQLDGTTMATPASGNAVFFVDADGDLLLSVDETDHSDMVYSLASDLTVIDTNNDDLADRAYFGDLGGQVWRLDFGNIQSSAEVQLSKLADLANGNHQPLFYAPSISMNRDRNGLFISVSIGSGDRTQPLAEHSQNAIFMLKDVHLDTGAPGASFSTINMADIYDATSNDIGSEDETVADNAQLALDASKGWSVFLATGEKSLSKLVTFEGKLLATTFEPDTVYTPSGDVDECQFNMIGRMYIMDVLDAQPIKILSDGSDVVANPSGANRITTLSEKTTIPSSPVIVYPADSDQVQIFVGKETIASVNKEVRTIFWHAK